MKNTNFSKVILSLAFLGTLLGSSYSFAQAGLFVEPTITYETSDSTINYPAPFSDSSGHVEGWGIGARLGFHVADIFFLGVDGRYSMPKFKDSSTNYDANSVSTTFAPVVGVQMPIVGLRVWGAAVIDGELNPESSGGYDVKFTQAQGYRVGVGFQIVLVSLNLEYQDVTYRDTTVESGGPFAPGTNLDNSDLTNKSWIVGLSFPLAL